MRAAGYALIVLGFLAGAYLAVSQPRGLPLPAFLGALAVGAVGIVLVRTALKRTATGAERLTADLASLEASLARIVDNARALDREKESIGVYDLRHRIDERFPGDVARFVEARPTLIHRFGLQAYADVMNPFSAGERYMNRVWSTSTDGYEDEAFEYTAQSREQFEHALAELRRLTGKGEERPAAGGARDVDLDDTTTLTGL
jgi:hypothetical protein